MLLTADLYIRVSTDEQAEKGYSQRDQEERLRKYCVFNGIQIGHVILEDHSAKNFNRPEWKKYTALVKRKKNVKADLLLFTKWDRFSRNAGDAYQAINFLNTRGISPQAIEQPLDLSVPENKMMLAIYLATPEIENDRRALNTFNGMRKAIKEGRMMGKAPFGYINRHSEDGKVKYVALKEPEANNFRWAFNEIAKGILAPEQIRREMNKRGGVKISPSAFHVGIRNPIYYGKILVPKYKDEEAELVKGNHEPLISEELFQKVQKILDGNKRMDRPKGKVICNENLPLRGFLVCPRCGKNLTGSGSKGTHSIFYYYHCTSSCGFRHSAINANVLFENEMKRYDYPIFIKEILKNLLLNSYKGISGNIDGRKKEVVTEIERINERLSVAREKFLHEKLDDEDYAAIRRELQEKLRQLEYELTKIQSEKKTSNIHDKLDKALEATLNLSKQYIEGDTETKRNILGSLFSSKFVFDGATYRTIKRNVVAEHILLINSDICFLKKRNYEEKIHSSCLVAPSRIELLSKV